MRLLVMAFSLACKFTRPADADLRRRKFLPTVEWLSDLRLMLSQKFEQIYVLVEG